LYDLSDMISILCLPLVLFFDYFFAPFSRWYSLLPLKALLPYDRGVVTILARW